MLTNIIHLNKLCQICLSDKFREDESGFYYCSQCGYKSEIRCLELLIK